MKVSQVIMEQELQNLKEQSSAQQIQDNLFWLTSTTSSASFLGRSHSNSSYCENTLDSQHANQTFCHVNTSMECSQSTDTHNTIVTNYFIQFNPQDQYKLIIIV
jgi:hypothetical protein